VVLGLQKVEFFLDPFNRFHYVQLERGRRSLTSGGSPGHGVSGSSSSGSDGRGVDHHLGISVFVPSCTVASACRALTLVSALIGGGGGRWVATHGITEAQVSPN